MEQQSKTTPITSEQDGIPLEKLVQLPKPFAFTRLPVHLPSYQGSAELLKWLLRRQLVEVKDVTVREIAQQVGTLTTEPLQTADELELAAELTWLKSALLLPKPETIEVIEEEDIEETEQLRRRLLRSAHYGLTAKFLAERSKIWGRMFPRLTEEDLNPLKEISISDKPIALLTEALRRVLARMAGLTVKIPRRRLTVPQCIRMVLQMLKTSPNKELTFDSLCSNCETLLEVILIFLAVLELARRRMINAKQDNPFSPIVIFLTS